MENHKLPLFQLVAVLGLILAGVVIAGVAAAELAKDVLRKYRKLVFP